MTVVTGIGWITPLEYGCVGLRLQGEHNGMKSLHARLLEESVIAAPVKHFGRFDSLSQLTCCAVGLALHDAQIPIDQGTKQDVGLLGSSARGSLQTNLDYFRDYVDNGRTLARGNLFIYTLPSSPLAEAAIYFGLSGPVLFIMSPDHGTAAVLHFAAGMILGGEAEKMLAVNSDERRTICFAIERRNGIGLDRHWNLDAAVNIVRHDLVLSAMVQLFVEELRGARSS